VKFYRAAPVNTIPAGQASAGDTGHADLAAALPGAAPVIAIRAADLVSPCGRALSCGFVGSRSSMMSQGSKRASDGRAPARACRVADASQRAPRTTMRR